MKVKIFIDMNKIRYKCTSIIVHKDRHFYALAYNRAHDIWFKHDDDIITQMPVKFDRTNNSCDFSITNDDIVGAFYVRANNPSRKRSRSSSSSSSSSSM